MNQQIRSFIKDYPTEAKRCGFSCYLPIVLLFLTSTFSQTVHGGFIYDDLRQVLRNPLITDPENFWKALSTDVWAFKGGGASSQYWRPTFVLWMILNVRAFGLDPFYWHLLHLILHGVVVVLAYFLTLKLGVTKIAATTCALIFAIHPSRVESVAWIAGATDLLLGFGLLGSFLTFCCSHDRPLSKLRLLSYVLYALALGSKEVAVVFPFIILTYVVFFRIGGGSLRESALQSLPYLALAVTYMIFRAVVIGGIFTSAATVSFESNILTLPKLGLFYLRQIVWPATLSPSYALRAVDLRTEIDTYDLFWALLVSTLIIFSVKRFMAKSSIAKLGVALGVTTLLPAMNLSAFPADDLVHDRYLYLPLLGVVWVVAPFIDSALNSMRARSIAIASVAALTANLAYQSYNYSKVWGSDLLLVERAVATNPESVLTRNQYAAALYRRKEFEKARVEYLQAFQHFPDPNAALGVAQCELELGNVIAAESYSSRVIANPTATDSYTLYLAFEALAVSFDRRRMYKEGEVTLRKAILMLPYFRAALTDKLAVTLYNLGEKHSALQELKQVEQLARQELLPESRLVLFHLGMLHAEIGSKIDSKKALEGFLRVTEQFDSAALRAARTVAAKTLYGR